MHFKPRTVNTTKAQEKRGEYWAPAHYNSGDIECREYIRDRLNAVHDLSPYEYYLWGNIIKYNHRLFEKGTFKENAEKIRVYLDFLETEEREDEIKEKMFQSLSGKELGGEARKKSEQGMYVSGQKKVKFPGVR